MSKEDFEKYWAVREEKTRKLVETMRLARVTGNMEGAFEKIGDTAVEMEKGLLEIDPLAFRCIGYTTEILQMEGRAQNKGKTITDEEMKKSGGLSRALNSQILMEHGKEFSLRLYDLLKELGV